MPFAISSVWFAAPDDDTTRANQSKGWDAKPRALRGSRAAECRRSSPGRHSKGQPGLRSRFGNWTTWMRRPCFFPSDPLRALGPERCSSTPGGAVVRTNAMHTSRTRPQAIPTARPAVRDLSPRLRGEDRGELQRSPSRDKGERAACRRWGPDGASLGRRRGASGADGDPRYRLPAPARFSVGTERIAMGSASALS